MCYLLISSSQHPLRCSYYYFHFRNGETGAQTYRYCSRLHGYHEAQPEFWLRLVWFSSQTLTHTLRCLQRSQTAFGVRTSCVPTGSEQGWSRRGMSSSMRGPFFLWISKTHFSEVLLESKGDILPWTIRQGSESSPGTSRAWLISLILLSRQPWLALWLCSFSPSCFLVSPSFQDNTCEMAGPSGPLVNVQRQCWPEMKSFQDLQGLKQKEIYSLNILRAEAVCLIHSCAPESYKVPRTKQVLSKCWMDELSCEKELPKVISQKTGVEWRAQVCSSPPEKSTRVCICVCAMCPKVKLKNPCDMLARVSTFPLCILRSGVVSVHGSCTAHLGVLPLRIFPFSPSPSLLLSLSNTHNMKFTIF